MKRALIFTLAAAGATANPLDYPEGHSTLAVASATGNPLAYPADHKWNFSLSIENGIESCSQNNVAYTSDYASYPTQTTGYKIASTQTAGYGKWFYLQSRLSYTVGYTSTSSYAYTSFPAKDSFFDGDWSIFFPFRIPSRHRVTLGPQLGVAYLIHEENWTRSVIALDKKLTYLTGLLGLAFGLQPTDAFALRAGLNFQFPKPKSSISVNGESRTIARFPAKRHCINAYMNVMYQLSKHFEISMTIEHKSFSAKKSIQVAPENEVSQSSRTSATGGVKWVF